MSMDTKKPVTKRTKKPPKTFNDLVEGAPAKPKAKRKPRAKETKPRKVNPATDPRFGSKKYNPDTSPGLIIRVYANGDSHATFCSQLNIGSKTFYRWAETYPEFAEAIDIGKMKQQKKHEDLAKQYMVGYEEDGKLNTTLWSMFARNRHGYTEHRRIKIPGLDTAKTPVEQLEKIMNQLALGRLTSLEAKNLTALVESATNIMEKTEMLKRIELLEASLESGVSDSEFKEE